jgi:hypothetical protein
VAITRLTGGNTPADGSDPRTFPAIWDEAVDEIEANAPARLFIPAAQIAADGGGITLATTGPGEWPKRNFAAGATVAVGAVAPVPASWTAVDTFLWWTPTSTAAGDVYWRWYSLANAATQRGPGDVLTTANTLVNHPTPTPEVAYQVVRTQLGIGDVLVSPGTKIIRFRFARVGLDALDTYPDTVSLLGLEVVPSP